METSPSYGIPLIWEMNPSSLAGKPIDFNRKPIDLKSKSIDFKRKSWKILQKSSKLDENLFLSQWQVLEASDHFKILLILRASITCEWVVYNQAKKSIDFNREPIGLESKSIDFKRKSIEVWPKSIEFSRKSFEIWRKSFEI